MRLAFVLFVVLSACGAKRTAPAWPKMTEKEVDGGESLAPKPSAVASADKDKDDDEDAAEAKPAEKTEKADAKPAEKTEAKPAETKPDAKPSEEVIITTEEIVIEIDE